MTVLAEADIHIEQPTSNAAPSLEPSRIEVSYEREIFEQNASEDNVEDAQSWRTISDSGSEELMLTAIRRLSGGDMDASVSSRTSPLDNLVPSSSSNSPNGCGSASDYDCYEPLWDPELARFKSVVRRNCLLKEPTTRDPLRLYADLRLTPINTDPGVWQVLSSAPGLNTTSFKWDYSLVSHGQLSSAWSLLKIGRDFDRISPVMRPIGVLETSGIHMDLCSALITNLENVHNASSLKVVHFPDSWAANASHIGFQVDEDYSYEWQIEDDGQGTSQNDLMLWRKNLSTGVEEPAARMTTQDLIQNPISHKTPLWCLDIDVDRIKPHLAFLSVMSIKLGHPKLHAWFSKKNTVIPPPVQLVNFAFQDEGRVYQPSGKFWGDWEEESACRQNNSNVTEITVIRVFNKNYMKPFAISPKVIEMLNLEAAKKAATIRSKCSIYD